MAVLKIMATSDGHPSVENIYEHVKKRFPTTSLATVYKTVTLLKELNEVLELGFPEEATAMTATDLILIRISSAPSVKKSLIRTWRVWRV